LHISSILVHADPPGVACVRGLIDAMPGLETHAATDDGRLVVTIEAPSEDASISLIDNVRTLPGVLAVAMVFHQFEPDPDQEI
jgi:nitrate reductase NapD